MTTTAPQSLIVPEIGKYHLLAELARGGMGNVYLAAMQGPGGFNKLVVVKELKPEFSGDETYIAMFLDEARLAARLNHPNIVQTNEVGSDGSRHYLVMEFLDGRSLHRIGRRLGSRFPVAAHLRVVSEVLLGLHCAHEMRDFDGSPLAIVHRDVSPLNVFVTFAGQTKVLDFGIAKAIDSSQETKMGVLKGRIAYMAPEQAKGARVDRRADIYSAGVMLWEAVSGRRFWAGCTEVEILTELLHERSRPLRSVCPQAPADLDRICSRAMAYHREHRYATAAELLHDLEDHLAHRRDAMSMREVSALVGTAFADERAKMNALIDEALSRVRGAPRSGVMPVVPAHLSGAATFTNIASEELAKPTVRLFTPGQSFSPSGISSLGSLSRSAPITSAIQPSPQPPPRVRNWSIRSGMLALACAGALVLGILFGGKLASREREVVAPSGAVPRVAPAKSLSEADLVDIAVRVSPPAAQIAIDGAPVANNPYHARHPKDDRIHHIVASADGYETRMEDVSFATDVSIDVSLSRRALNPPMQPQPQSAPVSAVAPPRAQIAKRPTPAPTASSAAISQAAPTAPPASPRIEVPSTGGRSPFRPISTANPYVSP